jgi:hypothetical protein
MPGRVGGAATYPLAASTAPPPPQPPRAEPFVVAVLDTGVVTHEGRPHPYLAAHLTEDWPDHVDELPADGAPLAQYDGHGTFVAGRILSEADGATIRMVRTLDKDAPVEPGHPTPDTVMAGAIQRLTDEPNLRLVNFSFVGIGYELDEPSVLKAALADLLDARPDVLVVTAAGNLGTGDPVWPARFAVDFDRVLAIGAVDGSTYPEPGATVPPLAVFSSYGDWVAGYAGGVQVLGPSCWHREDTGADGRPAQTFTGYSWWSGTSFAAATVTGKLAAAMLRGSTAAEARAEVFAGPPIPLPGIPDDRWRPYIA